MQEAVKRNSGVEVQLPASTLAILVPGGTVSAMSSTGAPTPLPTHTLSAATDTNRLSSTWESKNGILGLHYASMRHVPVPNFF